MKRTLITLVLLALVVCLAGCQQEPAPVEEYVPAATQSAELADYLASVKVRAEAIRTSLEQEALTQTDMNLKAQELAELWEAALEQVLAEAQKSLTAAAYEQLVAEQTVWEADKQAAVEAAGKAYEGGSMYALAVNMEAATRMEARVLELAETLMPAE